MFGDWKRYDIRYLQVTMPFPLLLVTAKWPHLWGLSAPVTYSWTWDLGDAHLMIPEGYQCDGASIPFQFYDVVDPICALPASFLHDLLYETQAGLRQYACRGKLISLVDALSGETILFTSNEDPDKPNHGERRTRADALFRAFLLHCGMSEGSAHRAYMGVRVAGEDAWESLEPVPVSTGLNTVLDEANV